ncbi:MAG: hypothetical protein PUK11_00505, partial [Oscillibacter sp.]|nr:hypothetical protein [Oscillibacter sp.]MDY5711958.1 hypothetical protein [Oscillospiraceae bacterium]
NSGKYAGRKRIVVDPNLFRQVAEDFRNHKVTEEEAMHRTGIRSRSTFYRRLKEIYSDFKKVKSVYTICAGSTASLPRSTIFPPRTTD